MNSSCKRLLCLLAWAAGQAFATEAAAIQLAAVYVAACTRDVGVILHADETRIQVLTLDGEIRAYRRFDIIYLAYYSVGSLPIAGVRNPGQVKAIAVKTRHGGAVVELARGWLIDHSDVEMSFLGLDGQEAMIRVDDIWDLEFAAEQQPVVFSQSPARYRFAHPYPFRFCVDETGARSPAAEAPGEEAPGEEAPGEEAPRTIFPQQILADPLLIKAELDRIQAGHKRLDGFAESKDFYAVPRVYGNDTRLGLWLNAGARYGSSRTRTNSLTPVLTSELSEGPFSFQRVLVAGAAPMPYSVHEEVQTQLYYRLKADYLHFSINYDVSRPLIGEGRYKWRQDDLNSRDDRWNETSHLAGGFDYASFAVDLSLTNVGYALRDGPRFFEDDADLTKTGLLYQRESLKVEFYYGLAFDSKPKVEDVAKGSSDEDIGAAQDELNKIADFSTVFKLYRLNISYAGTAADRFDFSLIQRTVKFHRLPIEGGSGEFLYRGRSLTGALYWSHALSADFGLIGMLAVEDQANRAGVAQLSGESYETFFKASVGVELKL